MPVRRSLVLVAPALLASVLLLSACVPPDTDDPGAGETGTASPSATGDPTASPTAAPEGIPIDIACDALIPAQAMYDYNPNFALEPSFTPATGTLAAEAVDLQGVACQWVNQSSGETIDVSVAQLTDDALAARANELVTTSNSVPTYDVEGYFTMNGSLGEAQAFSGPYWIAATSTAFLEPGDAAPIVTAAVAALG